MVETEPQFPSIARATRGLLPAHQVILEQRYWRLLPILCLLLRPSEIARRNRTWPGSKPEDKAATTYLSTKEASLAREIIATYAAQEHEDVGQLWPLFRAYCRYGPIGLLEALPSDGERLVPDMLQECADFYRLAKHPRADAGLYIRPLLDQYADDLGISRLPPFAARYAWATDRKFERWHTGDSASTEHVSRTTRRIVLGQPYPHKSWRTHLAPLDITCQLSRHTSTTVVRPWLLWVSDEHTGALMGYRICATEPTPQDLALTLRWSIWHFGAPWWPARGGPEILKAPQNLLEVNASSRRALSYLHTKLVPTPQTDAPDDDDGYLGWPDDFAGWLEHLRQRVPNLRSSQRWTITELNTMIAEYAQEALLRDISARSTSLELQQADCSLPWSTGIAAALLLPSAGILSTQSGRINVWGVPYEAPEGNLEGGQLVDVRYNPDDARRVYAVVGQASIVVAVASAFEHQMSWADLVSTREEIG